MNEDKYNKKQLIADSEQELVYKIKGFIQKGWFITKKDNKIEGFIVVNNKFKQIIYKRK